MTACSTFFRESLQHLELFSGIAHKLIEFSRAKLTKILTRQKTLEEKHAEEEAV